MSAILLAKLLDLLIASLAAYPLTQEKMTRLQAVLQKSIDEGRPLTDDEMSAVFSEAADLHDQIQEA